MGYRVGDYRKEPHNPEDEFRDCDLQEMIIRMKRRAAAAAEYHASNVAHDLARAKTQEQAAHDPVNAGKQENTLKRENP
jgi:hypothetical protein